MAASFGFVVKSDSNFYEGMCATIASIKQWYPEAPIAVIDCGLSGYHKQKLDHAGFDRVIKPDLTDYQVVEGSEEYYTSAVFGALECLPKLFDQTVHIDADAVLVSQVEALVASSAYDHGLAAVPDFPPLGLDFQIGTNPTSLQLVSKIIPTLNLSSVSFNGGVYSVRKSYFIEKLAPTISKLRETGVLLWGNEMALLNLAAFVANPNIPFLELPQVYNHRPSYRRAIGLGPILVEKVDGVSTPIVNGHFGKVKVLHFVGREKPWMKLVAETQSGSVWRYYRDKAEKNYGL